ncbi:MAG: site-2 protease family protein [Acidilobaceae archaeon]
MSNAPFLIVEEEFEIIEKKSFENRLEIVLGEPKKRDFKNALSKVYRDLMRSGYYSMLRSENRGLVLYVFREEYRGERVLLLIALALITLLTVTISSLAFENPEQTPRGFSWSILAYPLGLLVPLLVHELGHLLAMRARSVPSSLPYLLPAPPLQLGFLGTFGAVVNMRWLPATLEDLAFIALAGPLAGLLVALPLAYIGVAQSTVLQPGEVVEGAEIPAVPLVFLLLLATLDVPEGSVIVLSPMAFATMIFLFVTFLNLIPVGMLDGGHVVRALLGERLHRYVGLTVIGLVALIAIAYPIFFVYLLVLILLYTLSRGRHPGSSYGIEIESHYSRVIVALVYATLLILTLPVPIA